MWCQAHHKGPPGTAPFRQCSREIKMAAYGSIRKELARKLGEIPLLADLDSVVNAFKAAAEPKVHEVVRMVKVPDDTLLAEVRRLRREKIELEELLAEQRKASEKRALEWKERHEEFLQHLQCGVISPEVMVPNLAAHFMMGG